MRSKRRAVTPSLDGLHVVTLAPNVPGPVAAARLKSLGATITKVEGPGGDLLLTAAPAWYARLHDGVETLRLDLKEPADREVLHARLNVTDVLLTSSRPSAHERMGLAWDDLHAKHPQLIHVAIVGELPPNAERAGHDLTYLATAGLVNDDTLPRSLFADLAGAERAASAALAALLYRERTGEAVHCYVSLAEAAQALAEPLRAGLTKPGGVLGGAFAGYRVYRAADGFVALAALERHFFQRACDTLLAPATPYGSFAEAFAARSCAYWERAARELDLPLVAFPHG